MIELEVKLGPKTGLDTVQNEKHVEVEVASPDDSNQAPLVRVTPYLKLLIQHEENMKKLCKTMEGQDWERRKCVEEISKKRQERQELEMVWAIDRELEK